MKTLFDTLPKKRLPVVPEDLGLSRLAQGVAKGQLEVPLHRQEFPWSCGAAAARSTLLYFGIDITESDLRDEMGTTPEDGTEPDAIAYCLNALGLHAEMKTLSVSDLIACVDAGNPVIVDLQAWAEDPQTDYATALEDGHYVVLSGYDSENLHFADPANDKPVYLPRRSLDARWHDTTDEGQYFDHLGIVIERRATKRASDGDTGVPLSQTYVQRLLEKSLEIEPELDVSYGMGREKGAPLLLGLLKKIKANDYVTVQSNDQLLQWLEWRNVPEDELVELRKVPEPRQRILTPKWNEKKWEWFQDVAGKFVQYEGEFDPAFNKSLSDWGKAFEIIKAKYPQPWRIYMGRVKRVVVSGRGQSTNSTEDGSWQDYVNGGTLRLRLHQHSYGAAGYTGILLHEIGHVYEDSFDLLKIMDLDLYGMGHPPFVTQYASKNVSEDFAETFMYYWAKPSYLKSKAPMKYEDMHNRLTGKVASTQTRVASRYLLAKALDTKRWGGFTFEIDRPKGYVKTWDNPDGSVKKYKYPVDYGYFIGHTGEDDEGLDAFVGSDPAGKIESFLKLKPSDTDPDELVPDETKFLVGLTPKEREQVMSLYEPENVTEMQEYKDVYALISALTEYRTAKKIAKQTITEDTKVTGWEEFVKTEPIKAVKMDEDFEVETLEGTMQGKASDMLAQGIEGERWVIDADIFDKTYERAKKVASRYLQITAREEHYYVWVRKFPQVSETSFAAMDQHANGEGTEVSDDPKASLEMIVWDMGWQKEPLPTSKHHWVWDLASALKVDVRKEYAEGAASRGADD